MQRFTEPQGHPRIRYPNGAVEQIDHPGNVLEALASESRLQLQWAMTITHLRYVSFAGIGQLGEGTATTSYSSEQSAMDRRRPLVSFSSKYFFFS